MQITITARHCEIAPELRTFALERLDRCTRFAHDLQEARLVVTAEKFRHTAEISVHLSHHEIVSREEAPDMRVAIDLAIDGLEAQLRKLKGRRIDRNREGRAAPAGPGAPATASGEIED